MNLSNNYVETLWMISHLRSVLLTLDFFSDDIAHPKCLYHKLVIMIIAN